MDWASVEKAYESPIRGVDQLEGNLIARGRRRPRKIIDETIKIYLDFNSLIADIVYNRIL